MPKANVQGRRTAGAPPKTALERGQEARERLLATAVELIPELGWTAVSTRVLAQRAGLAPGLVHYHFESLQALLREASLASMREALRAIETLFEQANTLDAGLGMLVGALDAYSGNDPASLLFIEVYLASLRDTRLSAELAAMLVEFRRRFAGWLALHGQVEPAATAAVLAAALDGVLLHRALGPDLTSSVIRDILGRLLVQTVPSTVRRSSRARKGTDAR
jgi:AcrR family transcriptional regulator